MDKDVWWLLWRIFSIEEILAILNERDNERLLSKSKAFTKILKKYVHQFQIDQKDRDKDVYPFQCKGDCVLLGFGRR